jgi:hypothetical protein
MGHDAASISGLMIFRCQDGEGELPSLTDSGMRLGQKIDRRGCPGLSIMCPPSPLLFERQSPQASWQYTVTAPISTGQRAGCSLAGSVKQSGVLAPGPGPGRSDGAPGPGLSERWHAGGRLKHGGTGRRAMVRVAPRPGLAGVQGDRHGDPKCWPRRRRRRDRA